jgi:hypothetical protein
VGDFAELEWLLRHGTTEIWYKKPENHLIEKIGAPPMDGATEPERLSRASEVSPGRLDVPKVWMSAAMTTPTDEDVVSICTAGHRHRQSGTRICHPATMIKLDAEDDYPLSYNLVYTTNNVIKPYDPAGEAIYTMTKCGSREAALAHVYYTVGNNGWSLIFSCVTRRGEGFGERSGKVKMVNELRGLMNEDEDTESIRVFY